MTAEIGWAILIPLAGAVLSVAVGQRATRWVAGIAAAGTLLAAASVARSVALHRPLHHAAGGWLAPLGIGLRADGLAAVMLSAIALVGAIVTLHAAGSRPGRGRPASRLFALWLFAWAALDALVLSADIFNLYVTLELATLAAVGLVAIAGDRPASSAALRYLLFALPGSLVYLLGVAMLYGMFGTLDLGTLGARLGTSAPAATAVALMTAGLCLKAALFPLHAWPVPAYANASPLASGLLSALIGKGAFYVLLRLWLEVFPARFEARIGLLVGSLSAAAILWGSLQALWQPRLRMVIAYSSVAHTGYLFMCFALGTEHAWSGSVYVAISHAAAVAAMFVASGTISRAFGHDRVDGLTGLAHRLPVTCFALALAGTSLMGMPPSGGFIGKWLLVRAAIETGRWWSAAVMLAGGLLAAGYVFRILRGAFLPLPCGEHVHPVAPGGELAALALAAVAMLLGLVPGLALELLGASSPS